MQIRLQMNKSGLFPNNSNKIQKETATILKNIYAQNSFNPNAVEDNTFDKQKLARMYKFPAEYKQAQVHTIASKFGYSNSKLKNGEDVPVCPCCQNFVATIDIPLSYSTIPGKPQEGREVFLLPTGASMYFTFIKMVLFYLLIRLIVFDILNYILSASGQFCSKEALLTAGGTDKCAATSFLNMSGYNLASIQNQDVLDILDIVSLCFTVASLVYFSVVRKHMYKLLSWLDSNDISQMDFSILIENVPLFICDLETDKNSAVFEFQNQLKVRIEEKITQWFKVLDNLNEEEITDEIQYDFVRFIYTKNKKAQVKEEPIVTSITLCYDLTEMENLTKYRDQLIQKYLSKDEAQTAADKKNRVSATQIRSLAHIPNQIELLNNEYMNLCMQFAQNDTNAFNLSHFTGKAFVSFQYQHYGDYFIQSHEEWKQFFMINENVIKISKTNKPQDIYWYNMKVSDSDRAKNIFYSYAILFMLLILSFAALTGMQIWQKDQNKKVYDMKKISDFIASNLISISMAVITNVINFILSNSIELLSNVEQHQTKTQRLNSVIIKTICSQALNTSFIYYFLYLIFKNNPLGTHGLVNQVLNLVTVSGFISVILQIFPPSLLIRQLTNKYKYSPDKPINLFQIQLNEALQKPEFNYAIMYSFYIVFTFVVSFYGFIVPSATVIMIGIFFLQYWVDKYNLLRRYSSPVDFGPDLIRHIFRIFQFNALFFAAGYFFWSFTVHQKAKPAYRAICIVHICIPAIYLALSLIVPSKLRKKVLGDDPQDFDHHSYSYYIEQRKFKKTFFKESPATFCLKQTSLDNKSYVPQASDPIFVKEAEFQKYIDLKEEQLEIQTYDKLECEIYQNMDNDEYDQIAAEKAIVESAFIGSFKA